MYLSGKQGDGCRVLLRAAEHERLREVGAIPAPSIRQALAYSNAAVFRSLLASIGVKISS